MERRRVRLGILSDLHAAEPGTPDNRWINPQPLGRSSELLTTALDRLAAYDVAAIALLGDLTDEGTAAQLGLLRGRLAAATAPLWAIAGNHDLAGPLPDPLAAAGLSTPPADGASVGGALLAAGRLGRAPGTGVHREHGLPDPGRWPDDLPVVWLSHFPVLDLRSALARASLPHSGDLANRLDVQRALLRHGGPTLVLAGHLHVHAAVAEGNVLQLGHAPLIERPHSFAVLDLSFDADGLDVTWRAETLEPRDNAPVDPFLCGQHERWHWHGDGWERHGS